MITEISGEVCEEVVEFLIGKMGWASIHIGEPDFSSASESEYFSPAYGRAMVQWERLGTGVATNSEAIVWDGLVPPLQIAALGFMANPNGYSLTAYAVLKEPVHVVGSVWRLPPRQVTLRIF